MKMLHDLFLDTADRRGNHGSCRLRRPSDGASANVHGGQLGVWQVLSIMDPGRKENGGVELPVDATAQLTALEPDIPDTAAGGSTIRRRQRIALVVAIACAVVSTGGLVASTLVKSPRQLQAETGPPAATTLTAPVER